MGSAKGDRPDQIRAQSVSAGTLVSENARPFASSQFTKCQSQFAKITSLTLSALSILNTPNRNQTGQQIQGPNAGGGIGGGTDGKTDALLTELLELWQSLSDEHKRRLLADAKKQAEAKQR
jgi:hypothetical protein